MPRSPQPNSNKEIGLTGLEQVWTHLSQELSTEETDGKVPRLYVKMV